MRGSRIVPTGSAPLSQLTRNRSSSYSKFDLKKFLILKEKGRRRASLSTTLFYKFNKVIFNQKNCKTIFSDKFSNFKIIIYFFNILMVKVTCRVTSRQPSNVDYWLHKELGESIIDPWNDLVHWTYLSLSIYAHPKIIQLDLHTYPFSRRSHLPPITCKISAQKTLISISWVDVHRDQRWADRYQFWITERKSNGGRRNKIQQSQEIDHICSVD